MTPDIIAKLAKSEHQHKYDHGHALVLSGGMGRGGAARLAARGALRVGAGLVTLGCPPGALLEHATQLTAIMCRKIEGAAGLTAMLEDPRMSALCIGPGLGHSEEARGLVEAGLMSGRACVLDADALTILGQAPDLFARLHDRCVLTPHLGEFGRLFPDILDKLRTSAKAGATYSKSDATRDAARRAAATVLFKGSDTVIASPDGRTTTSAATGARSAPWLATAGSGDVLAGMLTGLLARGFPPQEAAETAAWLHVECARTVGPGLIAEDLPEALPAVFRAMGL